MKKLLFSFMLLPFFSEAQLKFNLADSIPVSQYGNTISNAWSGGINYAEWSEIDLNGDGLKDLFMFDRSNNRVLTMINNGAPNSGAFHYVDSFTTHFPKLNGWAFLYDYNRDGFPDLFSARNNGIIQYKGNYDAVNGYTFTCVDSLIQYKYGTNQHSNILEGAYLVPDFDDIDNDGDMDILALTSSCLGVYAYFKNNVVEDSLSLDSLNDYTLVTNEWGGFVLRGGAYPYVVADHFHDTTCPVFAAPFPGWSPDDVARRDDTYSVLKTIDLDGDGDKDALIGDSQAINVLALYNHGDSSFADMDFPQDTLFPSYNTPALMQSFTSCSSVDVDNDGLKDLLVGNSEFEDRRCVNWYKNTNTNSAPIFNLQTDSLFQPGMIDVGEGAAATLADVNGDGLLDMIIGNTHSTFSFNQEKTNLSLFLNVGTATNPSFHLATEDFASVTSLGIPGPLVPAFGDLDGDGDKDMLLGAFNGKLNYFVNNGGVFNFVSTGYMGIDVGNASAPQIIDMNRDGLLDLVVGEQNGVLNYYQNIGSVTTPFFNSIPTSNPFGNVDVHVVPYTDGYAVPFIFDDSGQFKLLVSNMDGNIFLYDSIDGNLTGSFHLVDTTFKKHFGYRYGFNCSVSGGDLNGDGLTDVIIGLYGGGAQIFYQDNPYLAVQESVKPSVLVNVFPNPAKDKLSVTAFQLSGTTTLSIYNMVGEKIVYSEQKTKNKKLRIEIDVSRFPSGIYLVQLQNENGTVSEKVMVERN